MKKQLLTLSKFIEVIKSNIKATTYQSEENGQGIEVESALNLVAVFKYDDILKLPLTLSQFIPCDSEGKPLEEPSNYDKWKECEEHGLELFFSNENECKAYEQALKAVIFEGFEVKFSSKIDFILSNSQYEIGFYKVKEGFVVKILEDSQIVSAIKSLQTISDLADATSENPINLR